MVTLDEFAPEIRRLHVSQGAGMDEKKLIEKTSAWFDLWGKFYADTGVEILRRMVDRAARQFDRVPSFGQFVALRPEVMGQDVRVQGYGRAPCTLCAGYGFLSPAKDGYVFAFRCHSCENWKGRCDGLPLWESGLLNEGYVFPSRAYVSAPRPAEARPKLKDGPWEETMDAAEKERVRRASLRQEEIRDGAVREPGQDDVEDPFGDIGYEYRK